MSKLWQCLEAIGAPGAVAAEWQAWTGKDFGAFKTAYLQNVPGLAMSYPCPQECGCAHEVVPHDDGSGVAVCQCDPASCDDFPVSADDRVIYRLNPGKLGRAIAKAFGCDARSADFGVSRTWQVAAFGNSALPLVLTLQPDAATFAGVVRQLVGQLGERFVLLAPTSRFLDGSIQGLLKKAKAGFLDLETNLVLTPSGTLQARKTGGELFSAYLPQASEPMDEDQARQLFALVEKIESGRRLKPPSVMEVFRLYCIRGKTTNQIVTGHRYSKGTVINRLKAIRRATNKDPDELRAFSPYLQRIEETITDSRAEYIHRKALVHDNKEDHDESE
jgi:hypothetical protein